MMTDNAKKYIEKMVTGPEPGLAETDPEFVERFANFTFDEVVNEPAAKLDDRTRFLAIIATLLGCQGLDEFRMMVPAALNFGLKPEEIKEVVYQAVNTLGIGRVYPFLKAVNEILSARGIRLPLQSGTITSYEDRLQKGNEIQVEIFGEEMKDSWKKAPAETRHIEKWKADNCFGDYFTRKFLSLQDRELCLFCFLAAQGGCEKQMVRQAKANMKIGNDRALLIRVVSQCVPYIGYPRSMNALQCIDEACR